jgi:hypothetical protein
MKGTLLWVIAVILAVVGIVQLIQGQIIFDRADHRSMPRRPRRLLTVQPIGLTSESGPQLSRRGVAGHRVR